MTARTVAVSLKASVGDFITNIGAASKTTKAFSEEMGRLGKDSPGKMDSIGHAAAGMGLALAAGFGYAVKASMDFDKQMSEVGAVSGATAAEMGKLRQAALSAGAATAFSATQAAQAEAELAKAGLSTSQILGGALAGSLALAAAGSIDLAQAADISAKTMNVFGLAGKDVGHIADLLAAAANKSATDVHEMGEALRMGGLAAHSAGISVEETVGTLAAFADHALVGSDAGTSLKTMLMMLQNPTLKATNTMRDLGLEVYDAQGNFIGIEKLAGALQTTMAGLTQEERNQALATIFGADAMRAANVLFDVGADGVRDYTNAVNDQGAAAEVAAKKTDNLAGDVERLQGSLETLAIGGGSGAAGGLRGLVQAADALVNSISVLPSGVQTGITVLTGIGGAAGLATAGLLKIRSSTNQALEALAGMGPAGEKAATGLGKVSAAAGRFAVAVIALQAFSAAWAAFATDPSAEALKIPKLSKDLDEFGRSGTVAGEVAKNFGKDLSLLKYDLGTLDTSAGAKFGNWIAGGVEGLTGLGNVMDESLLHARERIGELDGALAQMVTSGNTEGAQLAFNKIAEAAKKQGVNIDELKAGLPQYAAAMDGANAVQVKGIAVTEENANTTKLFAGTIRDAVSALGSFKDAFDRFNGGAITMSKATSAAEEAVDKMTETLAKNKAGLDATGTSFNLNTEAGRNNQAALIGVAETARDAAQAIYDQTGDVDAAAAAFNGYRQRLIDTLVQSGRTKAEAQALADTYMRMPPSVATKLMLYGTDVAEAQMQAIKDSLARLPGTKTININVKANLPSGISMGNIMHQAAGGTVDFYAGGGIRDVNRVAQIAPAGSWRVWGEPETGGEAYIPFAPAKRARSISILGEANARLGYPFGGKPGTNAGPYASMVASGANRDTGAPTAGNQSSQIDIVLHATDATTAHLIKSLRAEIRQNFGGDVQLGLGQGDR